MIEVLKQALEALEPFGTPRWAGSGVDKANQAIASLHQAIKDLESQEPVAWIAPRYEGGHENLEVVDEREFGAFRVYTHPPQRKPLTDDQIVAINDKHYNIAYRDFDADIAIARAIEAAHGIKGEA